LKTDVWMRKLRNEELNRLSLGEIKKVDKLPFMVVLDNVRSMHNIGSVFRTSDAFLVEKIYLCGVTAIPPHKDIHKTALGSTDSVEWAYFEKTIDAVEQLKSMGVKIIGIEQTENSCILENFYPKANEKYAVIFGHEVRGVDQEVLNRCDISIEIPQYGTKHSLNISVCAGIVIWEFFRKFRAKE
jgi:23S rRNA (guanosine2251-2'-O)-methyltransferase